jgi:hypothetical protein
MFGVRHAVIRIFSKFWEQLATEGNRQADLELVESHRIKSGSQKRRDAREDEWTGLENRRSGRIRGFESHSLRQIYMYVELRDVLSEIQKRLARLLVTGP